MTFQVRSELRPAVGDFDGRVWVLAETRGGAAEVCPSLGFNCFRWQVVRQGQPVELLYATPTFLEGDRPTRSGIPILFPFPNRIRDGRFTWQGREYQLPTNDPAGKNAIHGFACRRPWRVVDEGADASSAWVTAEFRGATDAPEGRALWPADHRLRLTYRLLPRGLRLEAIVDNPDPLPLPFGLGYHPYFRPLGAGTCEVQAAARSYWELHETLPTGKRLDVDPQRDLNTPRHVSDLELDDVLTDLDDTASTEAPGLCLRGSVRDFSGQISLKVFTSAAYRELVVFTPPHRQAICLEPYTCATDAINLQQCGVDAGLLVLPPGGMWTGVVELVV